MFIIVITEQLDQRDLSSLVPQCRSRSCLFRLQSCNDRVFNDLSLTTCVCSCMTCHVLILLLFN